MIYSLKPLYINSSLLFFTLISLLSSQKAVAQSLEITVDPYNNSGYETMPMEEKRVRQPYPSQNLLPNNSRLQPNEIIIKGNPTPPPPQINSQNLTTSNKILPSIPPISEPYSKTSTENQPPENTTLSVSASGFDITPETEKPISSIPVNPNTSPQVRTISVSPNQTLTVNSPSAQQLRQGENNINQNSNNTRQNLRDILVFSPDNQPNINQNKSITSVSSNGGNNIYKVLVKVTNSSQESEIKTLYPDAFRTNHQGTSFLQVGVFSNEATAQQLSQSLKNSGFLPLITPK